MSFFIKAQEIFTEQEIVQDQYLKVSDGRIAAIGEVPGSGEEVLDLGDCRVVPGFIDLHIHGSGGCDVMDGTHEALNTISKTIAANGVVGFLGTTVTDTWERNLAALKNVRNAMEQGVDGARLLGSYSEAIFFTKDFKGAHEGSYFRQPAREKLDEMLEAADGTLKALALAPELDGALDAIRYLTGKGVRVTVGHTGATYEQCTEAFKAGAVGGVHIFNQMLGLHHREPGTVGAVLHNRDIYAELIADGVHVDPVIMDLVYRLKGTEKTALITDCMCAGGLSDGEYQLGLLKVQVRDGVVRTESGSLAGSTLSLNRAVANMIELANVDPLSAVHMASLTPATILGLQDELGSIREGKSASLAVLDKNHEVVMTFVDGHQIFTKY